MNTKLRTEGKNHFEKVFFKLMNESVFGKPMGNVRRHRDVTLLTTDKKETNWYWNLIIIQHIDS